MKTSNVLASVLFGSLAAAAPVNHKRALVTFTSTVVQTEVVYTTVYAGDVPKGTSSPAAFFEKSSVQAAAPTTAKSPAIAVPSAVKPSSVKPSSAAPVPTLVQPSVPAVQPTTTAAPAKPTAPAAPVQPTTSAAPAKPTSVAPAAPAAPAASSAPSTGSGQVHSGGSMTLHPFGGAVGSCGKPIANTDMAVALASDLYGPSTYDVATGNPTNKWCGQKVAITYKGKTTTATILDRCDGCTNGGFDMSPSLWEAVTGTSTGDRITGMTWTAV